MSQNLRQLLANQRAAAVGRWPEWPEPEPMRHDRRAVAPSNRRRAGSTPLCGLARAVAAHAHSCGAIRAPFGRADTRLRAFYKRMVEGAAASAPRGAAPRGDDLARAYYVYTRTSARRAPCGRSNTGVPLHSILNDNGLAYGSR